MFLVDIGLLLGCLGSFAISAMLGVKFLATYRRVGSLEATDDAGLERSPAPHVCVIIPARNEAADIAETVESLLAQQGVTLRIIVVNDHSSDGTGEVLNELVTRHPQLSVVHNPPLRPGWFGKVNAMQHGLDRVTEELVLFTDADIHFHPRCVAIALAEFERLELDFLSLLPRFDCTTFWENVYMPHSFIGGCVQFLPRGINEQHSPDGAAAGAFMLARRSMLDELGGLQSVKQEMLDDVCLARAVKRSGYRGQLRFAPQLLSVEMFKTNSQAFWGTTKNILAAVDQLWKAVPMMFLPVVLYGLPWLALLYGAWGGKWWLVGCGAATYGLQVALITIVKPISRVRWPAALCFPLACIPIVCCMSVALYNRVVHRSVLWRGRRLQVDNV